MPLESRRVETLHNRPFLVRLLLCLVLMPLRHPVCKIKVHFICFIDVSSHLIRDMITEELEPLQFWKVFDARERLHCAGGPGELLELRCCSVSEADVGYGRALDSKKLKPWELIFTEGKLASDVRAVF